MANHLYTRAGGVWSSLSGLSSAEMADLDAKTVDSISASGGVYSFVENLILGGAVGVYVEVDTPLHLLNGLRIVSGHFDQFGTSTFYDDVTFNGTNFTTNAAFTTVGDNSSDILSVVAHSEFHAGVNFDDNVDFNDDVDFNAAATFHGVVTVGDDGADAFTVNAFAQFQATTVFGAQANFEALALFDGGVTLRSPLQFSSAGRIVQRQVLGGDADASYGITAATHVYVTAGTLSANHSYTIDDTGAQNGDRIRFTNDQFNHSINVLNPSAVTLATLINAASSDFSCEVERVGGVWKLVGRSHNP